MESNWMHHSQEFQERDQELQIFTLSFGLSLKHCRSGTGKSWNETAFMSKYNIICDSQCYLHQSPTSPDFILADFFKVQHRKREDLILAASVLAFCYSGGGRLKDLLVSFLSFSATLPPHQTSSFFHIPLSQDFFNFFFHGTAPDHSWAERLNTYSLQIGHQYRPRT